MIKDPTLNRSELDFLILPPAMKNILLFLSPLVFILACTDGGETAAAKKTVSLPDSVLQERWQLVRNFKDSIREGDLVVRCGNDFTIESFRDFSKKEKLYSHSGIALKHDGEMMVYSNMAGDINPDEVMRSDKLDSFLSPANNVAIGIYRYDLLQAELEKLRSIVETHYQNKLQFDMNFDLATDNKMYCAEMIAKSVQQATANRIMIPKSEVNDELRQKYLKIALDKKIIPSAKSVEQREYWAIDDLYLNPSCREVKKIIFNDPPKPIKFPAPENYQH